MKKILLLMILFLNVSLLISQEDKIKELNRESEKITELQSNLKTLHSNLLSVKMECDDLGVKAKIHQNDNMLKVYLKGLKDVYGLITDGPGTIFDVTKGAIENLVIEPYFTKARKVKVDFKKFKIEQIKYTDEVQKMYAALTLNLNSDLKYFDDDMPTSVYTKKYWRKGDNQPDDEAELCTRKLTVIIGLTGDLGNKIDQVCKQIRADYLTLDYVKDENGRLIKTLEKELKVNNEIRKRQKIRMEQFAKADAYEKQKQDPAFKEKERNNSREADDNAAMAMSLLKERQSNVAYLRKGYEIGKNATVHFVVNPKSTLVTGWNVLMTAGLKPENALGDLIWKVDDLVVGHNELTSGKEDQRRFSYVFYTPGIYDVSVTLEVEGKYVDKYLTQITIEPGNTWKAKEKTVNIELMNARNPMLLKKPSGNKKVQIVDFPYAKYWVSGAKGKEIISGFYLNQLGQKKEYTSLKIADYNPALPTYGLFALRSLNGYHVYRTFENDKPVLTIAFLKQTGPEIFKQIENVASFDVKIAPDFSKATINYITSAGNKSTVELE